MYISLSDRREKDTDDQALRAERDGVRATRVSATVVGLGVVSMLTDISSESVAAILPLYLTGALGLSTIAFGFVDGLYQGVSAIVRIAGGYASDRGDRPKWVAFAGYGLSAAARVFLLFASGLGAIVGIVTADRIGKGIRTAPRDALITASSRPEDLGRSFGVHRMLDTVGAAIGPLLAFLILFLIPDGYHTVFVVSLACALVGVAVLGLVIPDKRPRAERSTSGTARPRFAWRDLSNPRLRRVLLVAGLLGLLTIGDGFVYLVLQSRSAFAAAWFPLLYVGTNIAFLALAVPFGRLSDRIGRARMFVIGHLALLGTYVAAALPVAGLPLTVLCLLLLGAFYAATDGILAALAAESTPEGSRASGIAAAQTVVALSRLVASTGFGVLWFALGRTPAMIVAAVALAVVIPLVAVLLRGFRTSPRITA
ncbi:MFS transporter [Leifsonia sp. F6_8S_P_1B]|uniref:MFS transporter n=1 Tax=Leifsonia williamsii TaxID=3035919 RepID=A0ABT8K5Z2_9MICO|nr:MFS transporter [Leifsonia williamsii]MDN4612878.1 MFS transporter [Leifsonia williamsii]